MRYKTPLCSQCQLMALSDIPRCEFGMVEAIPGGEIRRRHCGVRDAPGASIEALPRTTPEADIDALIPRIELLRDITEKVCCDRIAYYERQS